MATSEVEIAPITDGQKLLDYWNEYGIQMLDWDQWPETLESGSSAVLAARLGQVAVGFVTIRWAGPYPRDYILIEQLRDYFSGETGPTPTVYALNVKEAYRRQGIGRDLMLAVEQCILGNPKAQPALALKVNEENALARHLYESLGYRYLEKDGEKVSIVVSPDPTPDGQWIDVEHRSMSMVKDLSKPA